MMMSCRRSLAGLTNREQSLAAERELRPGERWPAAWTADVPSSSRLQSRLRAAGDLTAEEVALLGDRGRRPPDVRRRTDERRPFLPDRGGAARSLKPPIEARAVTAS